MAINVVPFDGSKPTPVAKPPGNGDEGGMDDVLRRITALEGDMKEVKGILSDKLLPLMTRIDERTNNAVTKADVARIDERLKDMPTAKEFGELKGRVAQLPTAIQLVGFVIAIFVASGFIKYLT